MKISTLDLAKIALWPYVIGFMVSMIFYSRYHIFGLGLLSPHYIMIGIYVAHIYFVLPWALLSIAARVRPFRKATIILIPIVLLLIDAAIVWLFFGYLGAADLWPLICTILLLLIQLGAFLGGIFYFDISRIWSVGKAGLLMLAASLHFAIFFFGTIPYHMGGGRPAEVYVFPEITNCSLLDSQFEAGYGMQISTKRPSYAMLLLFETESEFFFLRGQFATFITPKKRQREKVNDNVVRVKKDTVERIDYTAPRWVTVSWR